MIHFKKRKINPGKTNKMLWAVIAGLGLLFLTMGGLLFIHKKPMDARAGISQSLAYLHRTEGIVEFRVFDPPLRVLIVYDANFTRKDFVAIARYAALRAAHEVDTLQVDLAKNSAEKVVYRIIIRNGSVVAEENPGQ